MSNGERDVAASIVAAMMKRDEMTAPQIAIAADMVDEQPRLVQILYSMYKRGHVLKTLLHRQNVYSLTELGRRAFEFSQQAANRVRAGATRTKTLDDVVLEATRGEPVPALFPRAADVISFPRSYLRAITAAALLAPVELSAQLRDALAAAVKEVA